MITANAVCWWALAAVSLVLIAAVITLWFSGRQIDAQAAEINRQAKTVTALEQNGRILGAQLEQAQRDLGAALGERDMARASLRELLDVRQAGYRWPRPEPMAMPPELDKAVDEALTEEFTKITERLRWSDWPDNGRPA